MLRHNYHLGSVEIDLITLDESGVFHFVEVKAWKSADWKHPLESLTSRKQGRYRRAALYFLGERQSPDPGDLIPESLASPEGEGLSFDLIWLDGEGRIEYYEGVF